jgi:hypothetical protein
MNDTDLELLEQHLDGATTPDQDAQIARRLTEDADLAIAFDQLRAERATRRQALASLEPTDAQVQSFLDRFDVARMSVRPRIQVARYLRYVSAVAACLLVGFVVGAMNRGGTNTGPGGAVLTTPVVTGNPNQPPAVQNNPRDTFYQVPLTDENGRVVAIQRFKSLDEARAFVEDINRWQQKQKQAANGEVRMVGDRF